MKKLLLGSCVAFLAFAVAGSAKANDFSGFYVGGFAGGVTSNAHVTTTSVYNPNGYMYAADIPVIAATGAHDLTPSAFSGGGDAGYNLQFTNLVIGAEVDFGSMRLNGAQSTTTSYPDPGFTNYSFTIAQTVKTSWLMTARPRVGVAFGRLLVFGTGGVAVTNINYQDVLTDNYEGAHENGGVVVTKSGWIAGGGVEYQLTRHASLKFEYLHADFGTATDTSANFTITAPAGTYPDVFTHTVSLSPNIARVGLNIRF